MAEGATLTKVQVQDVKAGDALPEVWTAQEDAVTVDGVTTIEVFTIGDLAARSTRQFADPGYEIEVLRA